MRKYLFLISPYLISLLIIFSIVFAQFSAHAGTFYKCTDEEGSVTLSDYPRAGQDCEQVRTHEKSKSTSGVNSAPERLGSANIPAGGRTTNIIVRGNRVLVPVTIVYRNNEANLHLVMDTGATGTTISTDIAYRLYINLGEARKAKAKVAGGGIIDVGVVSIDSLTVGPHTIYDWNIAVVPDEGQAADYDGLLGMDILGRFSFRIDLGKQVIFWE